MSRIGRKFKTAAILATVATAMVSASTARATLLFNYSDNSGAGFAGSSADGINIMLDDVLVPQALNPSNQPLAITKITFGILRAAAAPAVDVTGYWGTLTEPVDTNVDGNGFPILTTPLNTIGTQSLTDGPNSTFLEMVTFGNGIDTLFTVNPAFDDSAASGFGEFAVGLQFSTISASNLWALEDATNVPDSGNFFWGMAGVNAASAGETLNGDSSAFYLQVEGTPVPEPTTAALLGVGAFAGLVRRRRIA